MKLKNSPLLGIIFFAFTTNALNIGYLDISREQYGFSAGGPYLSFAKQSLIDSGYTLLPTNKITPEYLATVDAFYFGLTPISKPLESGELAALHDFVDENGGFLFVQSDWNKTTYVNRAQNVILGSYGITHDGRFYDDLGNYTVGSSDWVSKNELVSSFSSGYHSVITSYPSDFEPLAYDQLNRVILGVLNPSNSRKGTVLVSTDINMWDNYKGWKDSKNQILWSNIWSTVSAQYPTENSNEIPEPQILSFLVFGVLFLFGSKLRKKL